MKIPSSSQSKIQNPKSKNLRAGFTLIELLLVLVILGILAALNISAGIESLESALGFKFLDSNVYFIDYIPSQLMLQDVLLVCGAALLLSFLATLYPAWRAARTQPAEALRYE